jgi:hypothetical protein
VVTSTAYAEYVSIAARRDNTLHQDPSRSNGQGNIFVEQAVLEALCTRSGGEIPDGNW